MNGETVSQPLFHENVGRAKIEGVGLEYITLSLLETNNISVYFKSQGVVVPLCASKLYLNTVTIHRPHILRTWTKLANLEEASQNGEESGNI